MNEHYSTAKPSSEQVRGSYAILVNGSEVQITTVSGVFGKGKLDRGSQVLFTYADLSETREVLDLGCGTGVVGIALAKRFAHIDLTFSDVNERAVSIARENAKRNDVSGRFIVSDGLSAIDRSFDAIVLNPPQSAGKAVCERLISDAYEHLTPGGRLFVVARHQKGGRSLSAFMASIFGDIETVAKKSGYRVYVGRRT